MTAEELRKGISGMLDEFKSQATTNNQLSYAALTNALANIEIAAQLAELNANLVKLISSDPKTGWPRLTVDILK